MKRGIIMSSAGSVHGDVQVSAGGAACAVAQDAVVSAQSAASQGAASQGAVSQETQASKVQAFVEAFFLGEKGWFKDRPEIRDAVLRRCTSEQRDQLRQHADKEATTTVGFDIDLWLSFIQVESQEPRRCEEAAMQALNVATVFWRTAYQQHPNEAARRLASVFTKVISTYPSERVKQRSLEFIPSYPNDQQESSIASVLSRDPSVAEAIFDRIDNTKHSYPYNYISENELPIYMYLIVAAGSSDALVEKIRERVSKWCPCKAKDVLIPLADHLRKGELESCVELINKTYIPEVFPFCIELAIKSAPVQTRQARAEAILEMIGKILGPGMSDMEKTEKEYRCLKRTGADSIPASLADAMEDLEVRKKKWIQIEKLVIAVTAAVADNKEFAWKALLFLANRCQKRPRGIQQKEGAAAAAAVATTGAAAPAFPLIQLSGRAFIAIYERFLDPAMALLILECDTTGHETRSDGHSSNRNSSIDLWILQKCPDVETAARAIQFMTDYEASPEIDPKLLVADALFAGKNGFRDAMAVMERLPNRTRYTSDTDPYSTIAASLHGTYLKALLEFFYDDEAIFQIIKTITERKFALVEKVDIIKKILTTDFIFTQIGQGVVEQCKKLLEKLFGEAAGGLGGQSSRLMEEQMMKRLEKTLTICYASLCAFNEKAESLSPGAEKIAEKLLVRAELPPRWRFGGVVRAPLPLSRALQDTDQRRSLCQKAKGLMKAVQEGYKREFYESRVKKCEEDIDQITKLGEALNKMRIS